MAIDTTAGGPVGGVQYPCILYEGALTATAIVHGADGYYDRGVTAAAGLLKDQWVELDVQADNVYSATGGMPVVKALASNAAVALIGKIITEPTWKTAPPSTTTATWAADLARGAFRVATVWFPGLVAIDKVTVDGASTAAIVPGAVATINVDASLSNAAALAGVVETLVVKDAAANGLGIVPLTYVANGATDESLLVGFNGALPWLVA
jgi:hypothetical protein